MQNQKGNIGVIVSFIIVIFIIGLVVYALMNKAGVSTDNANHEGVANSQSSLPETPASTTPNQSNINQPKKTSMESNKKTLQNFTPVSSVASLQKTDLVVGTGAEVKAGDTVSVHYTGAIASTGVIFQSSKDFGPTPITFPLSGVIKGWTDGIPGMKIGGTRRLLIPSAQAYGANPPQGSGIPANADLVFDVELIGIK